MENQTQTSEVAETPATSDTPSDQPLIITLADLDLIRQIIDLAASRGAVKGPELSDVGRVYNKLSAFLDLAVAQSQTEQQDANTLSPGEQL